MEKDKITEKLLKEFDKKLNMEYYGDICEVNYGYIEEDIKKVIEETSKAKDKECCFEGCNKKAEKALGNNLTPNFKMCKEHFDLFQKHTNAREDCSKREKDEEFKDILDKMIKEAWNDNNAFCRKLKEYLGRHFLNNPEIKERCKDPYWKDKKQKQEKIE